MNQQIKNDDTQIIDLIHKFCQKANETSIDGMDKIIESYMSEFAKTLNIDFIMAIQPLLLFNRHEILYSPITPAVRAKLVTDMRKFSQYERVSLISKYDELTYISKENNPSPLLDSMVFQHIYAYPIINQFKKEYGDGCLFFVNKTHGFDMDKQKRRHITLFAETLIAIYNKYRITQMFHYEHSLMKEVQSCINIAICIYDFFGIIYEVNPAFSEMTGNSESECIGESILSVLELENHTNLTHYETVSKNIRMQQQKDEKIMYVDYINHRGEHLILKKYYRLIYKDKKTLRILFLEDVTKEFSNIEKIKSQSIHDRLTGLYNRYHYHEYMNHLKKSDDVYPLGIIVGDINGLKLINDIFGHQYGDMIITNIARILKEHCVGKNVFRMGGDEFYVFLHHADKKKAEDYITKVNQSCKEFFKEYSFVGIALGYSIFENNEIDIGPYIEKAESEMYYVKSVDSESIKSQSIDKFKEIYYKKVNGGRDRIQRMVSLGDHYATHLGLEDHEKEDLHNALALHDLGSIAVHLPLEDQNENDHINHMKEHCRIGYKIASLSYETSHLARIILNHHENWDGSGLPQKLKEKEIPFISRIISIIDFYDRSKNGNGEDQISQQEIKNKMMDKSGTWFDPVIVDSFLAFIDT